MNSSVKVWFVNYIPNNFESMYVWQIWFEVVCLTFGWVDFIFGWMVPFNSLLKCHHTHDVLVQMSDVLHFVLSRGETFDFERNVLFWLTIEKTTLRANVYVPFSTFVLKLFSFGLADACAGAVTHRFGPDTRQMTRQSAFTRERCYAGLTPWRTLWCVCGCQRRIPPHTQAVKWEWWLKESLFLLLPLHLCITIWAFEVLNE